MKSLVEALKRRGYDAVAVETKAEAKALVLEAAKTAQSVGWGGSESVKELGLREALQAEGKELRDHQLQMDLFLLSANAMTAEGIIVNIDGNGNRIAASIYGPKQVIYVVGRNKIVQGGIEDAIKRIKACACPPNARRLKRNTPCALTGTCNDCDSPDRMCKVTVIFDRAPTHTPTKVILVNEDLGY